MNLEYIGDIQNKIIQDYKEGKLDKKQLIDYFKKIGDQNAVNLIKSMKNINKHKDVIESLIENKKNITSQQIEIKSDKLNDVNEREVFKDKSFLEEGNIYVEIINYKGEKEKDILEFIKLDKSQHIDLNIEENNIYENNLYLNIKYKISFEKHTKPGVYQEYISITFKNIKTKIYQFMIVCHEERYHSYNFKFKNTQELYRIFLNDLELYKKSDYKDPYKLRIYKIFNNNSICDYLKYIDENIALDLYKSMNIREYNIEDINLFFDILGYGKREIYIRNKSKSNKRLKSINKKIDVNLSILKKIYIEGLDENSLISIYNNKKNEIQIKQLRDMIPKSINRLLQKIIKDKMEKFNSTIIVLNNKRLEWIFSRIRKESLDRKYKVIIKNKEKLSMVDLEINI